MKCSKRKCPIQYDSIFDTCDIPDCPYRTEDIDPQQVMNLLCDYIADIVVRRLKEDQDGNNI